MNVIDYINNHQDVNYCEAIIFPDGSVEDAIPSHTEKLISISNVPREVLCELMPMSAAPVAWLVDYNNCCSVWFDTGYLPENVTDEQMNTISLLIKEGILSANFKAVKLYEKSICELHQTMAKCSQEEFEVNKEKLDTIIQQKGLIDDFNR